MSSKRSTFLLHGSVLKEAAAQYDQFTVNDGPDDVYFVIVTVDEAADTASVRIDSQGTVAVSVPEARRFLLLAKLDTAVGGPVRELS